MKTSTYLYWIGWSVLLSGISMILSVAINILAYATGSMTFGTHTHSVVVETFDVLTTAFLLPLPFGFYRVYRAVSPRLSYLSTLVGAATFLAGTILHVLFVFTVLWFSDPISKYLYGVIGAGYVAWLVMIAVLAQRSGKPAHGLLINIIGATIAGFPIWAFTTAYVLLAGKLADRPNEPVRFPWLLVAAVVLTLFSAGRWAVPLAVWLTPVFLLLLARARRPLSGYLLVALIRAAAGMATLQGVIRAPAYAFYPLVLILLSVVSLPYLADRLIASRLRGFASTLVFPAAYTAIEYLGSLGPFGSFSSLANTQYGNLPLMQLASVTGVWGITFLITWLAAVAGWAWEQGFDWPRVRRGVLLYAAILFGVLLGGGARLALYSPQAAPVRVAGLSASQAASAAIDQQVPMDTMMAVMSGKGTPAERAAVSAAHARLADDLLARSQQEARAGAKIVIWPEAGAPVLQEDEPALIRRAAALARQEGIYLDLGLAVDLTQVPAGQPAAKDESVLIDPTGKVRWTYEKTHLVPFLETGAVVPGDGKVPLVDSPYGRLANVICFDLDFPGLIRQAAQGGADLMLAPANDWREVDPIHSQAAVFRAIEYGFSLVRQTSHGLSLVVDYEGHVLSASDYFTTGQQVMVADVPMRGVRTIYAAIGDVFAWLCVTGLAALAGLAVLRSRSAAPAPLPQPVTTSTSDTTL